MEKLEHSHDKEAIRKRLTEPLKSNYTRDWIYGGLDGTVTTFAVVTAAVGGKLAAVVIIILGFANLVADGFSMAAGNYLGTKSEKDLYNKYKKIEEKHIDLAPEGEEEEIRQIFGMKGIEGKLLEDLVAKITSDKKLWIEIMLEEEYGMPKVFRSPLKAAISTFASFNICGLLPLIPYLFNLEHSFLISCILTGVVFFAIGSLKSLWSVHSWFVAGLETLGVGAIAAGIAFGIGMLLGEIV